MKAKAIWLGKRRSALDDGRGHSTVVDLVAEKGGDNTGPSALELGVMALAGCVTTIFSGVAPRRRLPFTRMEVAIDAEQPEGAHTVARVNGIVDIWSDQSESDVKTAFDITLRECPLGILFENAGVRMEWTVNAHKP
jgi:putative redox protein